MHGEARRCRKRHGGARFFVSASEADAEKNGLAKAVEDRFCKEFSAPITAVEARFARVRPVE
jgi:hypothetical protein